MDSVDRLPAHLYHSNPTKGYYPHNVRDVVHVYFLLRQLTIPDLISLILDFAQYWIRLRTSRARCIEVTQGEVQYLSTPPLISPLRHPVRRIIFTVQSHDQGWSSYPQYRGTYEHSWTWFEARALGAEDGARTEVGGGGVGQEEREGEGEVMRISRMLVTNVHAKREMTEHVVVWKAGVRGGAEDSEGEFVRSLTGGERVAVVAKAVFPGWVNHVESLNIDLFCAAVR